MPFTTKLRQCNIFTGVCHSVHRGSTWAGTSRQVHPPPQIHSWAGTSPGRYTLRQVHPQAGTPPCRNTLNPNGHCSGRYASYWNAFLLILIFALGGIAVLIKGGKLQVEIRSYAAQKAWVSSGLTISTNR